MVAYVTSGNKFNTLNGGQYAFTFSLDKYYTVGAIKKDRSNFGESKLKVKYFCAFFLFLHVSQIWVKKVLQT